MAVEVRKIKGEDNPADLFTKHLPCKDKYHSLVKLFGCECRDGRSLAAPLLRPLDAAVVGSVCAAEKLPHLHSPDDIEALFPRFEAPPDDGIIGDHGDWQAGGAANYESGSFVSNNPLGRVRE